jgi:hypothetical protein
MPAKYLVVRPGIERREGNCVSNVANGPSREIVRTRHSRVGEGSPVQTGPTSAQKQSPFDGYRWPAHTTQNRDKVARLLRLFSSPRKRFGMTPDELLIFLAIGHLCTTEKNGNIQVTPIGLIDVSVLLGIPKETVRRKAARLAGMNYVSCTPKGVLIEAVEIWSEMLERALA